MPAIYVLLCAIVGVFGRHRYIGFWGFFVISLVLTPLITAIALAATTPGPDRRSA
jgi:hypothetical protein